MPDRIQSLEERVENLERELRHLRELVGQPPAPMQPVPAPPATASAASASEDTSEELLSWVGRSALLPRVSTLCFLLVVALILRTVTDSGVLDKQIGSLLGMAYATVLISVGWHKYRTASRLAPVFAVCGTLLMYSVVVETHAHFASLPSIPAYILLVATGVGAGLISYFHQSALPVLVGSLGMGLAALAIDYPNPYYPHLAVVLLIANVLGAFATRLQRCSWLRWSLLLVTLTMLQVWGIKVGIRWPKGGTDLAGLGPGWYLPIIALFTLTYLGMATWAALRGSERMTRFDWFLPALSSAWAFMAALQWARIRWDAAIGLGWLGVLVGMAYLWFAAWLAGRRGSGGPGVNAFALAGTALAALALPAAFGSLLASLPAVSFLALGLAMVSRTWQSGGLRLLSYLAQLYACAALVFQLQEGSGGSFGIAVVSTIALTALSLAHFQWCRWFPPAADMPLFSKWDPEDRSAILLFLAGLVNAFFMLRRMVYEVLEERGGEIMAPFQGSQSVIINLAAAVLILTSFRRRNRETRNVAVLVTLIGAGKVFIYDIFNISGMPLVLAVFSFGLTVSLLSVCLTRWQRGEVAAPAGSEG